MEDLIALLAMYLVLLPLWALFASPLLLLSIFLVRFMRRRAIRSVWAVIGLALAFSFLAAPVPTPIITVLVPHGSTLFDPTYYPYILHGPDMYADLWPWIISSLIVTFVVSLLAAWRYIRPPGSSFEPTPLRDMNLFKR